jgi:phospholipase/carboxylesterase
MRESARELAGLRTLVVGDPQAPLALVLLHGYGMKAADLAPFSHSLAIPMLYLLPEGPSTAASGGHGWWVSSIEEAGLAAPAEPRDLAALEPAGLARARECLGKFLGAAAAEFPARRWVLGGFSQGAILVLDLVLHGGSRPEGVMLLSASRISIREWSALQPRLAGLPVLVSHGRRDPDLAFQAGEALRDFLVSGGARVEWLPFEGGHEIPLNVWRGVRKFLRALLACVQ